MALTMTRTRTQTALTRLVTLLANLNGELEFLERLEKEWSAYRDALNSRRIKLTEDRAAVCATIRQFDPELSLAEVGTSSEWQRLYGSRSPKTAVQRYLKTLSVTS